MHSHDLSIGLPTTWEMKRAGESTFSLVGLIVVHICPLRPPPVSAPQSAPARVAAVCLFGGGCRRSEVGFELICLFGDGGWGAGVDGSLLQVAERDPGLPQVFFPLERPVRQRIIDRSSKRSGGEGGRGWQGM